LLAPRPGARRWGTYAGLRASDLNLLRVVSAFTLGHSLTLLLGATGWWHAPERLVEPLIAVSILVSAVHALRPLFPGKEPWIAAFFGLIHGLAFASTLDRLWLSPWG